MIHPLTFFEYVVEAKRNRKLMARIALNAVKGEGSAIERVDVSELRNLEEINRSVVLGYLGWCAAKSYDFRWPADEFEQLVAFAT